jgi:purine-binding chemotaxis protein CheW
MDKELEVLRKRAELLAGRKAGMDGSPSETLLIVEFILVPERYAVAASFVSEVLPLTEITPIPGAPAFVMGVINLRGKIVSVLNLKSRFNLKEKGLTDFNKVIILRNEQMEFGIVADSIAGTRSMQTDNLSEPPLTLSPVAMELVSGVSPDGVILLNTSRMLNSNQLIVNQKSYYQSK